MSIGVSHGSSRKTVFERMMINILELVKDSYYSSRKDNKC